MNNGRSSDDDNEDALIRRYHEAGDLEGRGPSAAVGDAVRAHARMLDAARLPSAQSVQQGLQDRVSVDRAANRARWRLSMLGSLAVIGLAGLLVLQFDRGPQQEQPVANGQRMAPPPMADAQAHKDAPPPAVPAPATTARAKSLTEPERADALRRLGPLQVPAMEAAPAAAPAGALSAREQTRDADAHANSDGNADPELHRLAAAGTWPALARRLATGAPIDERDAQGRTPLMRAAAAGRYEMVRQLLDAGADPRLVDHAGRSADQWAQQSGRDDVARLLTQATNGPGGAGR